MLSVLDGWKQAKHIFNNLNHHVFLSFFQDIFKQATEDRLTSANELPYFEGDFWPNVLEESIKELEQEEEERKKEENTAATETPEVQTLCQNLHILLSLRSILNFHSVNCFFLN